MAVEDVVELRSILGRYSGLLDPHAPPFNAKGDAHFAKNCSIAGGDNTITVPGYVFTSANIGQDVYSDMWFGKRSITAVAPGLDTTKMVVSGGALGSSPASNKVVTFGTDDTDAIQAALDACAFTATGAYVGDPTSGGGNLTMGRGIMLRSGRRYLISNPQAKFNAGRLSALTQHRRTGIFGPGSMMAGFIFAPNSYGDIIANKNARAYDTNGGLPATYCDFMMAQGFHIHGCRGLGQSNALDAILWNVSFEGYQLIDAWNTIDDVFVYEAPRDGFNLKGRGEFRGIGLRTSDAGRNGLRCDGIVDSAFVASSFGGSSRAGVYILTSANTRFDNIKAWYSGKTASTVPEETANYVLVADQPANGLVSLVNCEAQEARGSSFYMQNSGFNTMRGCRAQDPGRRPGIGALSAGVFPEIRAGLHMVGAGCRENDIDLFVQSAVSYFDGQRATTNDYFNGSHGLYIDGDVTGNRGSVEVMSEIKYTGRRQAEIPDGAPLGGAGVANGKNTRLKFNGAALT